VDKDVFGRSRSAEHESRALFVTGLVFDGSVQDSLDKLEAQIFRTFHVFGRLQLIRLVPSAAAAVVKYEGRASAEIAKTAMTGQPVGRAKAVGVRWTDDGKFRREEFFLRVCKMLESS
jgi:hypothetical protein